MPRKKKSKLPIDILTDDDHTLALEEVAGRDNPIFLRKRIQDLESEKLKLKLLLSENAEFTSQVTAAVAAARPFPVARKDSPVSRSRRNRGGHPVIPVLKLSDWHIGEVVREQETEGYNAFDYAVAEQRIFSIVDAFIKWVDISRAMYKIEECYIFGEGDWISGDIHEELMATNEFPVPVQTAKAGLLLGEVVARIAQHFSKVHFIGVGADNHGRLRKKPQAKQKSSNNYSYLVYEIAFAYWKNLGNVTFIRPESAKHLVNVNGFKILTEHGDTVRGWSGIPFYGFDRRIGKEAVRRMNSDRGFHYWSIGHFHVPSLFEGGRIFVNGSLSGTTEFDHLNGRYAKPAQTAFFIHPKHGWFNFIAFNG